MDRPRVALMLLTAGLLLAAIAVTAVDASSSAENAFLVVEKRVSLKRLKDGEKVTVKFGIYNTGGGTAYDVALNDATWPEDSFALLSGNISTSWVKLEGGAMVDHSFVLKATTKGPYVTPPATVTYRLASKSSLQTAKSTPVSTLDLLADKEAEVLVDIKAWLVKIWPLASAIAIVAIVIYIVIAPSKPSNKYSTGSKKRR